MLEEIDRENRSEANRTGFEKKKICQSEEVPTTVRRRS